MGVCRGKAASSASPGNNDRLVQWALEWCLGRCRRGGGCAIGSTGSCLALPHLHGFETEIVNLFLEEADINIVLRGLMLEAEGTHICQALAGCCYEKAIFSLEGKKSSLVLMGC